MATAQVMLPSTGLLQGEAAPQHQHQEEDLFDGLDSYAACFCCNPFENLLPESITLKGQAFDAILVRNAVTGQVASSAFFLHFEHPTTPYPPTATAVSNPNAACEALLEVEDEKLGKVYFTIQYDPITKKSQLQQPPHCQCMNQQQHDETCSTDSLELLSNLLQPGKNPVRYLFRNKQKGVLGVANASIYLWSDSDRLVVCDVDGTITKSNVKGLLDTLVTEKYSYCHDRVCRFLSNLKERASIKAAADGAQVNFLYLSSRPLMIANSTRKFLSNVRQPTDCASSEYKLPEGPLIGFGGRLSEVMKMELVTHSVHLFKASTLIDQVVAPFCKVSENPQAKHQSLFVAGFGNTFMDVQAYHMAGLELSKIYLIDKKSRISCLDADTSIVAEQEIALLKAKSKKRSRRISWRPKGLGSLSSFSNHSSNHITTIHSRTSVDPSSGDLSSSSSFAFDESSPENRPSLKEPMSRKTYKKFLGTSFMGYHDDDLHLHVLSQ
ncbi:Phosphatidate phosphatase [Seminavis robusta]|uniref:Phosphatidate phosphatase n=1 Tax=Seminavis robusta TaxID=568900 RepID=A0A9N8HBJ2_9STRA|nr:Phosphatidate phosphatase [Seminavis robusta]|eukprot:Sro263_g102300.1 Phosphatidate phosphatase (495) ;mRNA; f:46016-47500